MTRKVGKTLNLKSYKHCKTNDYFFSLLFFSILFVLSFSCLFSSLHFLFIIFSVISFPFSSSNLFIFPLLCHLLYFIFSPIILVFIFNKCWHGSFTGDLHRLEASAECRAERIAIMHEELYYSKLKASYCCHGSATRLARLLDLPAAGREQLVSQSVATQESIWPTLYDKGTLISCSI